MDYAYSYGIDATLRISDKYTGAVIYEPVTVIIPEKSYTQTGGQNLIINQPIVVDYDLYNDKAVKFVETYGLKDVTCVLEMTLRMNVSGSCEELSGESKNTYFTTLHFPLAVDKAEPTVTSSLSNGESKSMACTSSANKNVFLILGIVFGALDLIGGVIFFIFVYATRNHDINYGIKVKRLVANYRSFIQEISTPFATEGYQLVYIKTFNEMLEVRDTIGAPLLMYSNEDGTATTFYVPSTMGILYSYEIRVDDYDDIYGISDGGDSCVKKECFFKTLWAKIRDFFSRSKKAVPAEVTEAAEEEATEGEAADAEVTEAETAEAGATEAEATAEETTEDEPAEAEATKGESADVAEEEASSEVSEEAGEETAEQTVEDATEEGIDETAEKPATFKAKTKAVFLAIANAFKKGAQSTGNFFRGLFTKKNATKEEAEAEETPVEDASVQDDSSDTSITETTATEKTETPDEEAPVDDGTDVSEQEEPTAVGAADANQD